MKKLVIELDMFDEKRRSKAMKIVVGAEGLASVAVDEKDNKKLVVIGEDMDAFEIVKSLRKKKFRAIMESLDEVKSEKKDEKKEDKKPEENKPVEKWPCVCHPNLHQHIAYPVPVVSSYGYDFDPWSIF
ncbi:uncharacterized protein LOC116251117 isoform X2 [Nymphaea colorata]|uniref:uncharacterized protein LOC116251117 isoform X2 n=1 Tax=Nymphaea colorata TaxID=210225 RepID=UPI00129DC9CF|nr:uncharacterized protein LOC116251117 isoform X2 [Nymphaea colorata]